MTGKRGFTLIELVLVISIVALLVMAVSLTGGVRENARLHAAAESIRTLRIAADSYIAAGSMTYAGISIEGLKTAGFLPANFSATGSNPWGGNYVVLANADPNKVDISLTSVAATASSRLSALFANSAAATNYSAQTWTATF